MSEDKEKFSTPHEFVCYCCRNLSSYPIHCFQDDGVGKLLCGDCWFMLRGYFTQLCRRKGMPEVTVES